MTEMLIDPTFHFLQRAKLNHSSKLRGSRKLYIIKRWRSFTIAESKRAKFTNPFLYIKENPWLSVRVEFVYFITSLTNLFNSFLSVWKAKKKCFVNSSFLLLFFVKSTAGFSCFILFHFFSYVWVDKSCSNGFVVYCRIHLNSGTEPRFSWLCMASFSQLSFFLK